MLQTIIFDFDGVICESVDVKTQAFKRLFRHCPQHVDNIIQYHMDNGGLSRFEKFKVIYRDFLKKSLTEKESKKLGEKFARYSFDAVVKAPFVKGTHEFLNKYYKQFSLFIVSGTPQEEMIAIVKERGLDKFFKGVYGSPATKGELIKGLLTKNRVQADKAIFVGDSINDYHGAQEVEVKFIGRIHKNYPNPFEGLNTRSLIADMDDLTHLIENGNFL